VLSERQRIVRKKDSFPEKWGSQVPRAYILCSSWVEFEYKWQEASLFYTSHQIHILYSNGDINREG